MVSRYVRSALRSIRRTPFSAPGFRKDAERTGGLWPLAAQGRINWFRPDRDKPVQVHGLPGGGSRIHTGKVGAGTLPAFAADGRSESEDE